MGQTPQAVPKVSLPNIPVQAVEEFSKMWKTPGGLSLMLDAPTKQFALDFARVTLRSFVIANMQAARKVAAEAQKAQAAPQQPETTTTGSIILTDL